MFEADLGYTSGGLEEQRGQSQSPRPTVVGKVLEIPLLPPLNWVIKGLHTQSKGDLKKLSTTSPLLVNLWEVSFGSELSIEDKERWMIVTCGFPSHPGI